MSIPISLRGDFKASQLRALARKTKDGPQARRLLALAAIYDGATRTEAALARGRYPSLIFSAGNCWSERKDLNLRPRHRDPRYFGPILDPPGSSMILGGSAKQFLCFDSYAYWSEREDLNLRPLVSQTSALTGLRHAPMPFP
jgi:hypothetical protein